MNKRVLIFFISLGIFYTCGIQIFAQTDSTTRFSKAYNRILGNADLSVGKVRGFVPGDSITVILHSERAILEAKGDDFLFYRVLCDSIVSAEITYTFDEHGLLISTGIEFFESGICDQKASLSEEFFKYLNLYYGNCIAKENGLFECKSITGRHADFQKQKDEMCFMHTQIEFY